ncbi:MAG: SLC13 family permease [Planctomyces sp.]|jgi:sodium-dependent dicarboxylate transporter 2/3/5
MDDLTSSPPSETDSTSVSPWLTMAIVAVACGVLFLPTPTGMTAAAHRLLGVAVLMAGLWMTQAIPLAAASLLPLALFPLLGIQSAKETAKTYAEDSLFLYIGGMVIALGIERWQLHRRMALAVVSFVGASPRRLVIGFSLATFLLSMWISNTATTMLMLPIALAMLQVLEEPETAGGPRRKSALAVPLLLCLAYSSTLGGMATPVGSPTNSVAVGIYREQLPGAPDVYFSDWLLVCGPLALSYLVIVVASLLRGLPGTTPADAQMRSELRARRQRLGSLAQAEWLMLVVFGLTALLWVFREPLVIGRVHIFSGWQWYFAAVCGWVTGDAALQEQLLGRGAISDATVAILMAVLLFLLPSGCRNPQGRAIPLMDWPTAVRLPWDMILLFGGGFALASAFEKTQLAQWLAKSLEGPLQGQPAWLAVGTICLILVLLTELTSNVATVTAVLPSLLALAEPLGLDPRMLFIPATLAASAGFMLPVGTPPNAIVFGTGRIPATEMARRGLLLNLVGVPLLTAGAWLIIRPLLGIP